MMNAEKYKKYLETEEGQKSLKRFVEEIEKKEKAQKELVETDNYIKWLEKFTEEHPNFDDTTWLYFPEKISKENNDRVNQLCDFFTAIDKYAETNYIYPTPCEYGAYYSIVYNGKVYEIGLIVGQGALTFCNTSNINDEATVICFEDIATPSEATLIRTQIIENQLERIDELFRELLVMKIPLEAILYRADKVLKEFQKNNK